MQQELNALAGSSTKDYENYRKQVTAFAESWRQHLLPFLYNNEPFSTEDYENLPEFQYQRLTSDTTLISIIALVFIALIGVILGFLKGVGSQSTEKFINPIA